MSYVKYFFIIAFIIAFILFLYYAYKKKQCPIGYSGLECSDDSKSCPKNCSGKSGVCDTTTGKCNCNTGYSGLDCSTHNQSCPKNCSGSTNGTCDTTTGKCKCNTGYSGDDCSDDSKSCPKNCSGKSGVCDTTTVKCKCNTGYSGDDCSDDTKSCPNNCSSHGNCNQGVCSCIGYSGDDCSIANPIQCSSPCKNGSACDTTKGICTCPPGYEGVDCSQILCNPSCLEGNAVCDKTTGKCKCNTGFEGADCLCQICPDNSTCNHGDHVAVNLSPPIGSCSDSPWQCFRQDTKTGKTTCRYDSKYCIDHWGKSVFPSFYFNHPICKW